MTKEVKYHEWEPLIANNESVHFRIRFEDNESDASASFEVDEVTSWTYPDNEISDTELYLKGYVKWDGCSHFWFGDGDGYMHLCGKQCWDNHKLVMDAIWDVVTKRIKGFDFKAAR